MYYVMSCPHTPQSPFPPPMYLWSLISQRSLLSWRHHNDTTLVLELRIMLWNWAQGSFFEITTTTSDTPYLYVLQLYQIPSVPPPLHQHHHHPLSILFGCIMFWNTNIIPIHNMTMGKFLNRSLTENWPAVPSQQTQYKRFGLRFKVRQLNIVFNFRALSILATGYPLNICQHWKKKSTNVCLQTPGYA